MSRLQQGLTRPEQLAAGHGGNSAASGMSMASAAGAAANQELRGAQAAHPRQAGRQARLSRVSDLTRHPAPRESAWSIEHLCDTENPLLNRMERERLIDEVLDETFGFGPLEVAAQGPDDQRHPRSTARTRSTSSAAASWRRPTSSSATTTTCCRSSTASCRRSAGAWTKRRPMVDARLPDGSRVNAIIPPLALDGADA